MGTAIVIGVGPDQGLGAQLCKRFAAEGLHVLVAGRTRAALDAVVADIVASGGRATAVVADATSEADTAALSARVDADEAVLRVDDRPREQVGLTDEAGDDLLVVVDPRRVDLGLGLHQVADPLVGFGHHHVAQPDRTDQVALVVGDRQRIDGDMIRPAVSSG